MIIDSYLASLLVALKPNLMAYSSLFFFGVMRMTHLPVVLLVEELSTCMTHSA